MAPTMVQWCDGKERGIITEAFQLGRVRPAIAADLTTLPLHLGDYSLSGFDQAFAEYSATLEARRDGKVVLVLTHCATAPPTRSTSSWIPPGT